MEVVPRPPLAVTSLPACTCAVRPARDGGFEELAVAERLLLSKVPRRWCRRAGRDCGRRRTEGWAVTAAPAWLARTSPGRAGRGVPPLSQVGDVRPRPRSGPALFLTDGFSVLRPARLFPLPSEARAGGGLVEAVFPEGRGGPGACRPRPPSCGLRLSSGGDCRRHLARGPELTLPAGAVVWV